MLNDTIKKLSKKEVKYVSSFHRNKTLIFDINNRLPLIKVHE